MVQGFFDICSEKIHDTLPSQHPYDHTIDLQPTFVPKIAQVYSSNPTEMETCKKFVGEHLSVMQVVKLVSRV